MRDFGCFACTDFDLKCIVKYIQLPSMASFPESTSNIEQDIQERSAAAWKHKFVVHNQNYVVLSIVDAGKPPAAVKIFGTFASVEEANATSAEISAQNDCFDVYVADTNAWLPVPCGNDFVENIHYQEEKMNKIREGFAVIKEKNATAIAETIKKDREDKIDRAQKAEDAHEKGPCGAQQHSTQDTRGRTSSLG